MEHPGVEWGRSLSGLEPVRLEFPYADPQRVRKAAILSAVFYVVFFAIPIAMAFREPKGTACLWTMLVGMLAVCEGVVWSWYHLWSSRPPEVVVLEGRTMRVVRTGIRGAPAESEFNLLEIHDLRVAKYEGLRYALVWPLPRAHRPPVYDTSEPIRFTYLHRGYSIGGAPAVEGILQPVVDRIAAYDAEVRARLGMPANPNIVTFDRERAARATADGWDVDVIAGALE